MKSRYISWVENLKWDWCVSRQRYFGVPIPVWYCKNCGTPVFPEPRQLPLNPLETPYKGTCACGCEAFIPESAVFDTWATSSVSPQINERLGQKLTPMGMRTQAHEIIRTWAFYTIVRSLYHTGNIPWKDIMLCGWVLAKKGEKISKSKNNNELEPVRLIAAHSADALRYWTAGARLGTDTFFSPDELAGAKRFITKLWNASKFAILNLHDFNPADKPELPPIDRWIMERENETAQNAAKCLYEYEIGSARYEIDGFFWKDFCDNYIEIVKERLYEPDIHGSEARAAGQYALYYTLLNILKLYSIYTPHITEYIYQSFFRQYEKTPSIHTTLWDKPVPADADILRFGDKVKNVMSEVRKFKSEHNLSMRAEMEPVTVETEPRLCVWFEQTRKDLLACTNARGLNSVSAGR